MAEAATTQLTPALVGPRRTRWSRRRAGERPPSGASLAETLAAAGHAVDLAPEHYLGAAPALVDAALQARAAAR